MKKKKNKKESELEEKIKKLLIERFQVWQRLVRINNFVRGTVVELRRTCTYDGCKKCKSGEKHPADYLSTSKNGKTRLVYIPKYQKSEIIELTENYKELKNLIEDISDINVKLIKLRSKLKQEEDKKNGKKQNGG